MVPVGGRGGVGPCPPRHQTQRPFWKGGEGAACLGEPQAGRDRHEGMWGGAACPSRVAMGLGGL